MLVMPTKDKNIDDAWIEKLIQQLYEEINAYQDFLNKLNAQKNAIIDRDVLRIAESTRTAEDSQKRAAAASQQRSLILRRSENLQPSHELDSIERVIPIVAQQYSALLTEARVTLRTLLQEIQVSNRVIRHLLQHSLAYVTHNLQLIDRELRSDSYDRRGRRKTASPVSSLTHSE